MTVSLTDMYGNPIKLVPDIVVLSCPYCKEEVHVYGGNIDICESCENEVALVLDSVSDWKLIKWNQ